MKKHRGQLVGNEPCERFADYFLRTGNILSPHEDSIAWLKRRQIWKVIVLGNLMALYFMLSQSGQRPAERHRIISAPGEHRTGRFSNRFRSIQFCDQCFIAVGATRNTRAVFRFTFRTEHVGPRYGRSIASATALPPPKHSAAIPRFKFRRCISYNSVTSTRAPDAPIGCPSATAPPFTFTFSGLSFSTRVTAIAATANASFNSTRSTSLSRSHPVFFSSFSTASTGAIITHFGSTPLTAWATIRAIGVFPSRVAFFSLVTITAAAPSFVPGAFPAVTVPSFLNAGLSLPSASSEVSSRGDSSVLIITA